MTMFAGAMRWLMVLATSVVLAGCINTGSRGGKIPYEVQNFTAPDAPKVASASETYRVFPLDVLSMKVFQVPDLSQDYTVDLSGNLSVPLVGSIPAAGRTIPELENAVQAKLGEKYLKNPNVSLIVKESKRMTVAVDGAVQQPGLFPVTGPLSLMQAVALARGVNDFANPRRIAVFRTIEGKRMAAAFDLVSIRRGQMEDPAIYPGDIVVVDGSNIRAAQRELMNNIPLLAIFSAIM